MSIETTEPSVIPDQIVPSRLDTPSLDTPVFETPGFGTQEKSSTLGITLSMWLLVVLWIACVGGAFYLTVGSSGAYKSLSPVSWAGLSALILLPSFMILAMGYMAKRVVKLSYQSSALLRAADDLTRPDGATQTRVTSLAHAIRSQVISVDAELKSSLDRLAGMETVIAGHTKALNDSHLTAARETEEIAKRLTQEREGLQAISTNFDERMGALSRLLSQHSERLSQATHIAEQKIQEARVSVEGAAAKINASSEIVKDNAIAATQALASSETSINGLGQSIQNQTVALNEISAHHTRELGSLVTQLTHEQERMGEAMEARISHMRDMSLSAKLSANHLNEASDAGRATIESLAEAASLADEAVKKRFTEMEEMVAFSSNKAESITGRAAQRVRDSLSLTRMEISRIEEDMRELEKRLSDRTLEFDRSHSTLNVTPKSGLRKSLLRFRPAEPDEAPEPLISARPTKNQNSTSMLGSESVPEPMTNSASERAPAPKPAPTPTLTSKVLAASPSSSTRLPKAQLETPAASNQGFDIPDYIGAPVDPEAIAPNSAQYSMEESSLELTFEAAKPPAEPSLAFDIPADITPLAASRIDPPQLRKRQHKSGWGLRNLFKSTPPASNAQAFETWSAQSDDLIASLTQLSLAPNVVVGANCVMEAAEMRASSGTTRMRESVSLHLNEPVAHLRKVFTTSPETYEKCQAFATKYYQFLSTSEGDVNALRKHLETESGRAFLLCDAALS